MPNPKILQTRRWPHAAEDALNALFDVTVDDLDRPLSRDELINGIKTHDGIAVTVTDKIDAEVIAAAAEGQCQIIANFGVGVNHI
ncbi:MAG: D-glycerate dehydrogenase, partial [Alphaproteobacteria bacterium]